MPITRLFAARLLAAAALLVPAAAMAASDAPPAPATAPPAAAEPAPAPTPALPSIPKIATGPDLYEMLKASGQFTILVKSIDATNLMGTLKGTPNITLFAPTDDAFRALPADQLARLMMPANANLLQQILVYHVIGAPVDSSKIKGAKGPVPSAEKSPLVLDGSNPADLLVNNADIIQADVRAGNGGILHAIDKVLIPSDSPMASALATPAPAPTAPPTPAGG